MGYPKTIRFESRIEEKIRLYLKKNPSLKLAKLVNLAVEKFISEPHTIELTPVDSQEWEEATISAYKKHKKAMDELK